MPLVLGSTREPAVVMILLYDKIPGYHCVHDTMVRNVIPTIYGMACVMTFVVSTHQFTLS